MLILLIFAFLAGIITVLSPCILPVLPILLSAGITQNYYRQYGIILGLIISFSFFTLTLTYLVKITGISANTLRYISISLIIFFGLSMIFDSIDRIFNFITEPFSKLGNTIEENKIENRINNGSGFIPGIIFGAALGLIWTPCAGPILATITTLVASNSVTFKAVLVTLSYSIGTALPMFLIIYGGSKAVSSINIIAPYTNLIRKTFGILMILGALAILFHFDIILQEIAIKYFPVIKVENNKFVIKELNNLKKGENMENNLSIDSVDAIVGNKAPDFIGIVNWINSSDLNLDKLKGKVVLVDFWTYSCINCVRTLPYLKKWYELYKDNNFVIVGVHTPEFEFEKDISNVKDAVERFEIKYPVAMDNNYATWNNYNNKYWPAHYLIDKDGVIRYTHFGEGEYEKTENIIRSLLGLNKIEEKKESFVISEQTPEIYLGFMRAQNYTPEIIVSPKKTIEYNFKNILSNDQVGLNGKWIIFSEAITSKDNNASLSLNFIAKHVYLVMSCENPSLIKVLLDGKPVPKEYYTKDMNDDGEILVKESRMYEILDLKELQGRHTLTLLVPENISLYAFTFGGK